MDERLLDITVRELLEKAGSQIVRKSLYWPNFECRIDQYHSITVKGVSGMQVPITVRIKITAVSNWAEDGKA